jgi:diguanylate cyclase (GGDEF)-like protein
MQLYATDDALHAVEARLNRSTGAARLAALVETIWLLRERDSKRAATLAEEAERFLQAAPDSALSARLELARSDISALFNDLPASRAFLASARQFYTATKDELGLCDADIAEAVQAIAEGDTLAARAACDKALVHAEAAGDPQRAAIIRGWNAYFLAYSDPVAALEAVHAMREADPDAGTALVALRNAADAAASFWRDPARSLLAVLRTREFARSAGLLRLSIMASVNAGWVLEVLGDYDSALECIEWGVSRARETGWPAVTAASMVRLGAVLCELGDYERSHDVIRETLKCLDGMPRSMHRGIALGSLGQVLLRQGRAEESVAAYREAARICRDLDSTDNLVDSAIHLARALSAAGDADGALESLYEARQLISTHGFAERGVALHQAMAEIQGAHQLPPPDGISPDGARLHFLEQALEAGRAVEGWQPSASLLLALAEACHATGDMGRAYEHARQALKSAQSHANRQAANRSVMMQTRHDTEKALADAAHHREMAAALAQQSHTLEELGRIGQEITAQLDEAEVIAVLGRHINALADAPHLAVWLLDPGGTRMKLRHGIEDGKPLPPHEFPLEDTSSLAAACVRKGEEILVEEEADKAVATLPGTRPMLTAYFAPLAVAGRVLGAITLQSGLPRAYGERELLIFRTLSAYTAIALDNTRAYDELKLARARLEEASLTDPLTGLRNRRYLQQHIDTEVALALRAHQQGATDQGDLIFLMVDIDHFKQVNDRHGHAAGDAVLIEMRSRLAPLFRSTDHLIRWGGEEFLVVARATHRSRLPELAARICAAVRCNPFQLPDGTALIRTCSVGAACLPFDPKWPRTQRWQDVLDLADAALYAVKNAGRDGWAALMAPAAGVPMGANIRDVPAAVTDGVLRLEGSRSAEDLLTALRAVAAP